MRRFLLAMPFALLSLSIMGQEAPVQEAPNTLDNQMTELFEKSNSYQKYKVIDKAKLTQLQRNVLDSISGLDQTIQQQHVELSRQLNEIDSLSTQLRRTHEELEISKGKEDGIEVFGISTSKTAYNTLMWSIIAILLFIAALFIYRFSNSHSTIRETRSKVDELETEMEELRRNNLEREQKLRRKLQDEINKNRSV